MAWNVEKVIKASNFHQMINDSSFQNCEETSMWGPLSSFPETLKGVTYFKHLKQGNPKYLFKNNTKSNVYKNNVEKLKYIFFLSWQINKTSFLCKWGPSLRLFWLKTRKEMPELKKIKLHLFLNLATNFC